MVKTSKLRVGQHVLVGSEHADFSIPKHLVKINGIGEGFILTDPEQGDLNKYHEYEIEGIDIEEKILQLHGFKKSHLRSNRWIWVDPETQDRITYEFPDGSMSANGKEHVQRTGCRKLHELETIIADVEINLVFYP